MDKIYTFTTSELQTFADAVCQRTLEVTGLTSGMISGREATRRFGRSFLAGVKEGQIPPIFKSASAHAQKAYRVSDIQAYIFASSHQARLATEQSHTNIINNES